MTSDADEADAAVAEHDRPSRESKPETRRTESNDRAGKSDSQSKDEDHGKDDGKTQHRSRWPFIIAALIAVVAVAGGAWYWFSTRNIETTDDAYTDGNSVSIAPKVAGYVTELNVNDNTPVKAGQLLLKIDPRDYIAARDQAQANLALAQAQLLSAQIDLQVTRVRAPSTLQQAQAQLDQARANQNEAELAYKRQHNVDPRATTQAQIDQANAQLRSSTASVSSAQAQLDVARLVQQTIQAAEATVQQRQAQVKQAQASLEQAEVNLSYTEIRAPQDGFVTKRNVDLGTYLQAGQQVFYIVTPQTWITANFKETQLNRMRPGQAVTVRVDAYPGLKLEGHVQSIQHGSGAEFSAFPPENATGNFVKIVRRVPVKIVIDSGLGDRQTLPLGISVEPTVKLQ